MWTFYITMYATKLPYQVLCPNTILFYFILKDKYYYINFKIYFKERAAQTEKASTY